MANLHERLTDALASKGYDILLDCPELKPEQTREEYVSQYRAFYGELAKAAAAQLESA